MRVSVRELKHNLSRYLRLASDGTPVVVTHHRKQLARLQRILQTGDAGLDKALQAEGTDWNGRKPRLGAGVKPRINGRSAADYVLDGRG